MARRGPAGQGRLRAGHGQRPSRECHTPHDVSFDVRQGEILSMPGRNRAGKTAPLKALIGKAPASSAAVALDGEVIAGLPSAAIAWAGWAAFHRTGAFRGHGGATASNPAVPAAPATARIGTTTRSLNTLRSVPGGWTPRPTARRGARSRWPPRPAPCRATPASCCRTSRSTRVPLPWSSSFPHLRPPVHRHHGPQPGLALAPSDRTVRAAPRAGVP